MGWIKVESDYRLVDTVHRINGREPESWLKSLTWSQGTYSKHYFFPQGSSCFLIEIGLETWSREGGWEIEYERKRNNKLLKLNFVSWELHRDTYKDLRTAILPIKSDTAVTDSIQYLGS